jgi:hypothetical protein
VDLRRGRGLEVDGSRLLLGGFAFRIILGVEGVQLFEEALGGAFGLIGAELRGWSEEAVLGIVDDLADDFCGWIGGAGFGQVAAGDLKAVEEQAGAARVDVVGGDAAEDFADGLLDGGMVFGIGKVESGLTAAAGGSVLDGPAGVVVVVAKAFGAVGAADGGAAATAAVGEDVAALEASGFGLGCDGFRCHRCGPLPGVLCAKSWIQVS